MTQSQLALSTKKVGPFSFSQKQFSNMSVTCQMYTHLHVQLQFQHVCDMSNMYMSVQLQLQFEHVSACHIVLLQHVVMQQIVMQISLQA